MKIRTGFVSNSSSSSFMLAWKGDLKEELKKAFHIEDKEYPIKSFGQIADEFVHCLDKTSWAETGMTDKDIREFYGLFEEDEKEDEDSQLITWIKQGYKVAAGAFADDDGDIQQWLCNIDIHWDKENLKIYHNGGY